MAEFTSSAQVSPFPDENILFNSASGITGQQIQQNQLMNQTRQLELTAADHEQVGRLAAGLLNEPDPAKRADLYSRGVGMLQSQGLAKYAPPSLPDESTLRSLVSQSVPVGDQIKTGLYTPPGLTDALARANAPLPGQPGYGGGTGTATASPLAIPARGTGGPGASASAPTAWLPYFYEASKETGVPVDLLIAQARQESGFNPDAKGQAGEVGLFQIKPSTAASPGFGLPPVDPATLTGPDNVRNNIMFGARYLKARMGGGDPNNSAVQAAGLHAYNGGGDPNYVANVFRYRPGTAPGDPQNAVTTYMPPGAGTATASTAAPGAPQAGGGPAAPYQVASNAPVPPPGSVAAPGGAPAAPPVPGAVAGAAPPAAAVAPAPAAQPPASTGTGVQSPQFQAALEMNRRATALETQFPFSPQAKAQAASLRAQAALYMQADSVIQNPDGTQTKQLTGERLNAAAPLAHYVWNEQQGAYVDTTGVHPPVTPPSPRITMTPGGTAIQSKPGGGATVVYQSPATTPPTASYDQQAKAYSDDLPTIKTIAESGRSAQASALQLNELADVIKDVKTGGALPEFRAKVAALMEANGAKPETIEALTGMKSGTDAQVLQKLAVATIGASAKADLGSNVGVESLNVYANANPGLDKLQDANKRVTNMIRVARAQIDSYTLGAQQHFNQNQTSMLHTPQGQVPDYHPLSEYNQQWQAQNNPQIGAAAIGILNGDGFDKWAARATPEEARNAVQLAARIDPNAQIPVSGGGFKSAQEILSHGMGQ